jgi:hypothetical protein
MEMSEILMEIGQMDILAKSFSMISADEKLFSLSLSWKMFFEFFHVFIM